MDRNSLFPLYSYNYLLLPQREEGEGEGCGLHTHEETLLGICMEYNIFLSLIVIWVLCKDMASYQLLADSRLIGLA